MMIKQSEITLLVLLNKELGKRLPIKLNENHNLWARFDQKKRSKNLNSK